MVKRLFKALYYIIVIAIIFVLLGLAIDSNKSVVCNYFDVNVDHSCGNFFIDAGRIEVEVYKSFDTLPGKKLKNISLGKIENFISGMTYVKSAEVYRTIDGQIKAEVKQRKPLARIINNSGQSFYIDKDGKLMPASNDFTARVIIVTGDINAKYTPVIDLNEPLIDEFNDKDNNILKEIYELTSYIHGNKLLSSFIDQAYVTSNNEFELIPKNGIHVIEFGNTDRMEQKFHKLMVFYKHGLTKLGWNKYSRLNLKYKNQVVCVN